MREIKFRLWGPVSNTYTGEPWMEFVTLNMLLYHDGYYHSTGGEAEGDFILMEYTGVEDGSGKEIYEGDIIEERNEGEQVFIGVVKFKKGEFFIDGRGANIIYALSRNLTISINEKRVIGNIHENAGLLAAAPPRP